MAEYAMCSVAGCNTESRTKSGRYCNKHYYRLRRNGALTLSPRIESKQCVGCGSWFSKPKSQAHRYKSCSAECRARTSRAARERQCLHCGTKFFVKELGIIRRGGGRYCSNECSRKATLPALRSEAARKKIAAAKWKGGRAASMQRYRESGKERISKQIWRSKNIERVREWGRQHDAKRPEHAAAQGARRRARLRSQICSHADCPAAIRALYRSRPSGHEVDHIVPIARGGMHCINNLQILSKEENRRKAAR